MILQNSGQEAVSTVSNKATKFGISENGQKFIIEALSKNIYKNPIGTIIREYVSNAYDANREAGHDEPVIVKIGTDASGDFLSITDYGVGLSPERIEKVFCLYGESTKRNTNDQIGGFGIGAKSAFSYVDMFNINTVVDGTLYRYILYKANGEPTMQALAVEPTELRNGTEIRILIQPKDVRKFNDEVYNQLRYFDGVYFEKENTSFNNFKIYEFDTFKYSTQQNDNFNKLHIAIGKVAYPVDFSLLKMDTIHLPFALKFEIGELPVTLSREELQYDEDTIKIVKDKINVFKKEVQKLYNERPKEFSTLSEFLLERENNPSLKIGESRFAVDSLVTSARLIYTPLKGVCDVPTNPFFFMKNTTKFSEAGNIIGFQHGRYSFNIAKFSKITDAVGDTLILLDTEDSNVKNRFIYETVDSPVILSIDRLKYKEYVHILKLRPSARSLNTINNYQRILKYKEVMIKEAGVIFNLYSDIVVDPQFIIELEKEKKRILQERKEERLRKKNSGEICLGNPNQRFGKGFQKVYLNLDTFSYKKGDVNIYCSKEEVDELISFVKKIKTFVPSRAEFNTYVALTQKEFDVLKGDKRFIHIDAFKKRFMSKPYSALKHYMINHVIKSDTHNNVLNFIQNDSLHRVVSKALKKKIKAISYKAGEVYGDGSGAHLLFKPSDFYIPVDILFQFKKISRFEEVFPIVFEQSSSSWHHPLQKEVLPKGFNKMMIKMGMLPGNNSQQLINVWEKELLQDAKNKVSYLQSLTK